MVFPWSAAPVSSDEVYNNQKVSVAKCEGDLSSFEHFLKIVDKCTEKCGAGYSVRCTRGVPPNTSPANPPKGYSAASDRECKGQQWLLSQGAFKDTGNNGVSCNVYAYGMRDCTRDCMSFEAGALVRQGVDVFGRSGSQQSRSLD
eukprot:TRINITY_DN27129_c0_g1_i1.p1 TRINITY_DN27129_c0_g1~~TRINITY_DN27129_c0_g1_i1.p1  ORF type:complete len:145 (+),score=12.58 TRINITY_DN27129_c0_g1_i1:75-509(+)